MKSNPIEKGIQASPASGIPTGFIDAAKLGRGLTYRYPHDFPHHWTAQQYLPDELKGARYYEYGPNKTEQAAKAYWEKVKG